MKRTLTAPQASELRWVVAHLSAPYAGRGPSRRTVNRLRDEGLVRWVEYRGMIVPTARGVEWVERALAKRMADAETAHGSDLPSHLRHDYDRWIGAIARARDWLAGEGGAL